MPHIIVEYSANLRGALDMQGFVNALHDAALATGVFPVGGVRTRAHETEVYRVADGHPDNAFIHIVLRVGHGRDVSTRKRACEQIHAFVCKELDALFGRIPLGMSLEMQEIDPQFASRKNNLHEYVKRRAGPVTSST